MSAMHIFEQHIQFKDIEFVAIYSATTLVLALMIVFIWERILRFVKSSGRNTRER